MARKRAILRTVSDLLDLLFNTLTVLLIGVDYVDRDTLRKVKEGGLIRKRLPKASPLILAFRLGKHEIDEPDDRPLDEVLEDAPELTDDEVDYLRETNTRRIKDSLNMYLHKLKQEFGNRFQGSLVEYFIEVTPADRLRTQTELQQFLDEAGKKVMDALERAVRAEGLSAHQFGSVSGMIGRSIQLGIPPDQIKVKMLVRPDACDDCKRIYLEDPKNIERRRVFLLKDLLMNGTNAGRPKHMWRPTIPPLHPNCVCIISQHLD